MKWTPHKYQFHAIKFLISHACAGLLLDPGLGKTSIVYAAFCLLKKKKAARRMLVVAPLKPAYLTWPAEARKWEQFHGLKVGVLHGPNKQALLDDPTIDVHVINPEGLQWLFTKVPDPADYWEVLTIDESTRFKHTNTQRFKTLRPRLERFRRRYILTGSPAPNGLLDIFGQIYILDLGNALGRFITHYRSNYFDPDYMGFNWAPRADSAERIYKKISPLVLRMSAADYLEMPPLIGACGGEGEPLVSYVELPPEARKAYDQMEAVMVTVLSSETVTAANAAAASGKCRQIANGGIYGVEVTSSGDSHLHRSQPTGERSSHNLHTEKVDAVAAIVEELQGTPALVAYEFQHDRDRLLAKFGKGTPWLGGGVTPKRLKEIEAAWNRGEIPVLLAQPQSVAHGINLQATKAHVIWHSIPWDLELYQQLIARVWRQGQADRVFVHHIAAKGTIDEVVLKMLRRKDKVQFDLLAALQVAYSPARAKLAHA